MDLQLIKDYAQIAFWVVATGLALLTYINAKKSIFSSVNTEYQKRAFASLEKISAQLFLYPDNEIRFNHLLVEFPMEREYKRFQQAYQENPLRIQVCGLDDSQFSHPLEWEILTTLKNSVECDIFLPEEVRKPILELLSSRCNASFNAHVEALSSYIKYMQESGNYESLKEEIYSMELKNYYIDSLEDQGFGVDSAHVWNKTVFGIISLYVENFHKKVKS